MKFDSAVKQLSTPARMLAIPFAQHRLDVLALQVFLRAAQIARDDRKLPHLGPAFEVFFFHIGERADDDVLAVIGDELGRHGLELAAEEHVQESGFEDVVAMMAERDLGRAEFARHAVKHTASQPRAQGASGLAFGHHALHDRIGVLIFDVMLHAALSQIFWQHILGETRLALIEIDRDDVEMQRRAFAQREQDVEQTEAVLAAGHADHDAVAFFDHVEIADRFADLAAQALLQLVVFVGEFFGAPPFGGRGRAGDHDSIHFCTSFT